MPRCPLAMAAAAAYTATSRRPSMSRACRSRSSARLHHSSASRLSSSSKERKDVFAGDKEARRARRRAAAAPRRCTLCAMRAHGHRRCLSRPSAGAMRDTLCAQRRLRHAEVAARARRKRSRHAGNAAIYLRSTMPQRRRRRAHLFNVLIDIFIPFDADACASSCVCARRRCYRRR